jgi:hypothetical protein
MEQPDEAPSEDLSHKDPKSDSDSDYEDGETVLARGWPRNYRNLAKHGFRPVWTTWDGYPGKIPSDIAEYLDDDGNCSEFDSGLALQGIKLTHIDSAKMIGPLRSIAWVAGLDELVEAIDHPAYVIQDEIEGVPFWGAGYTFPVNRHMAEWRIPPRIWNAIGQSQPGVTSLTRASVPLAVKTSPTSYRLTDFYPTSRIRSSSTVKCFKIPSDKKISRLSASIRRLASPDLASTKLWFRGLDLAALESTLGFFIPERNSSNKDNELGPGFYTTENLEYACEYARNGGGVMVFRDPDLYTTRVWQPNLQEWSSWVARWLTLPLAIANEPVPSQYLTADFIKGAIAGSRPGPTVLPMQSDDEQLLAVSYRGCEVLSESLDMIIFVERV